jgi:hypothetical protein
MEEKGCGLCPGFQLDLALDLQVCKVTEDIIQFRGRIVLRYEMHYVRAAEENSGSTNES